MQEKINLVQYLIINNTLTTIQPLPFGSSWMFLESLYNNYLCALITEDISNFSGNTVCLRILWCELRFAALNAKVCSGDLQCDAPWTIIYVNICPSLLSCRHGNLPSFHCCPLHCSSIKLQPQMVVVACFCCTSSRGLEVSQWHPLIYASFHKLE